MPRPLRSAALLSILALLIFTTTCALTVCVKAQNEVAWVYDYPTGMKMAAEKNKPVLIYIHEQWCPRCRNMDQNTWNNTEVVALSSSFVNINVVGTEQGPLYNYSKPPMVVFTDPIGNVLEKHNTELSASEVTALQRKILAQAPFASSSPSASPTNAVARISNNALQSSSNAAKAAGVPGFETTISVASLAIAAVSMLIVQHLRRRARP